ncbi:MAG: hypothetical protein LQ338_007955, partial [Usnochroma carphineum]
MADNSSIFVKQGRLTKAWSRPPGLDLGIKADEEVSPLCAAFSKSIHDEIDEIGSKKITDKNTRHQRRLSIVVHQNDKKSTLRPSKDGDSLKSTSASGDEKLSVEGATTTQFHTSNKTIKFDKEGRSGPVAQKDSASLYTSLQQTFGIDVDAEKVTCLAKSTKGPKDQKRKCTKGISKNSLKEARQVLKSLLLRSTQEDFRKRSELLVTLAELLVCKHWYHQRNAISFAQAWEAAITHASERHIVIDAVCIPTRTAKSSLPTKLTTKSGEFDTSQVCIRNFVPFDARAKSRVDTRDFVRGAVERTLTPKEITHEGLIYVYWFPGNFGHIKIGLTTKTVEERLHQWERKCGHETHLEFP